MYVWVWLGPDQPGLHDVAELDSVMDGVVVCYEREVNHDPCTLAQSHVDHVLKGSLLRQCKPGGLGCPIVFG